MVAISAQMNANLLGLLAVNEDLATTQDRLASGKKVSSALDNPAVFFRAQTYSTRADALGTVNEQMGLATKNLATVSNALDTMYKNLDGTLSTLKDARSKAVVAATKVSATTGNAYNAITSGGAFIRNANIVASKPTGGAAATSLNDSTMFQMGDTFAVTVTDTSTGTTSTKWFRALDGGVKETKADGTAGTNALNTSYAVNKDGRYVTAANQNAAVLAGGAPGTTAVLADGSTEILAYNFTDLASLQASLQAAFGQDDLTVDIRTGDTAGSTVLLGLTGGTDSTSISFTQVQNADPTAAAGTRSGSAFDFGRLFGGTSVIGTRSAIAGQNMVSTTASVAAGQSLNTTSFISYTWSPTNGTGTSLASALETRRQAADTYKQTLYSLSTMINDAANPGFANILKGELFSVDLNETGEVKQNFRMDAINLFTTFGFAVDANGTISANNTAGNFSVDTDLSAAINATSSFLQTLRIRQNAVTAASTMLTSRLDYNKAQVKNLNEAANSMTAADTAEEAAKSAALQTQQAFATNNLSITKQAEQSLLQLLR